MRKNLNLRANISLGLIFAFLVNTLGPLPTAAAQDFRLPSPGSRVHLSSEFNPPILKGIKVYSNNPFRFDFILDQGDSPSFKVNSPLFYKEGLGEFRESLKQEATQLIKYFLASLTIPEKDLWVNLSPYEKNRIVPESFGQTEMGRDLLAEDYMLKQITASLIYPEDAIGKKFWKRIYEEAQKKFGTTNIPVNTFNKVWIIPDKAVVYENVKAGAAYVIESKLKVMLEEDYLSLGKHSAVNGEWLMVNGQKQNTTNTSPIDNSPLTINQLGSQIVREIIIPELTKEVNTGKNFARLRQVYNSLILATWYKKKIKDSILQQVYADKNKIKGLSFQNTNPTMSSPNALIGDPQHIYQQYLQAFKKGVYNYIKEDFDPTTRETVPKKYFSGGVLLRPSQAMIIVNTARLPQEDLYGHGYIVNSNFAMINHDPEHFGLLEQKKKATRHHGHEAINVENRAMGTGLNGDREGQAGQKQPTYKTREELVSQLQEIKRGFFAEIDEQKPDYDQLESRESIETYKKWVYQLKGRHVEEINQAGKLKGIIDFNKRQLKAILEVITKHKGRHIYQSAWNIIERLGRLLCQADAPYAETEPDGRSIKTSLKVHNYPSQWVFLVVFFLSRWEIIKGDLFWPKYLFFLIYCNFLEWFRADFSGHELTHIVQFNVIERVHSKLNPPYTLENFEYFFDLENITFRRSTPPNKEKLKEVVANIVEQAENILGKNLAMNAQIPAVHYKRIKKKDHDHAMKMKGPPVVLNNQSRVHSSTGGVDLTTANTNLVTKNDPRLYVNSWASFGGRGVRFHLDPAQLAQLRNAPGFMIGSITIKPLKDLSAFLGEGH